MDAGGLERASRRRWLRHCSVLIAAPRLQAAGGAVALHSGLAFGQTTAVPAQTVKPAITPPVTQPKSPPHILVVGDSLSAEYGLTRGSGWVALLEKRLAQDKVAAQVTNASISGETTSGGRSRLAALLQQHRPSHVVIELGGNDALRGLPLAMTRDNLLAMAQTAKAAGAKVMLLGMQLPPNYGARYGQDFAATFGAVAKAEGAALVPFLLAGVADGPQAAALFQPDRIHPTAAAHPIMLGNVWPVLKPWLR